MRIPFPERIPLSYGTIFAFVLLALQIATGTTTLFSLLSFFFILIAVVAFNAAGGLTRPSGSYVFFFTIFAFLLGVITKIIFREPVETRLLVPIATMETYVGGMLGMLAAAFLSRKFTPKKGLLQDFVNDSNMRRASIGCLVFGVIFAFLPLYANGPETVFTPLLRASNQLDKFLEVSIILGVTWQIRSSGGKRSLNVPILLAWAAIYIEGVIIGYSKEALFSPFVCWITVAAVQRYNFKPRQLILAGVFFVFCFEYMVPFCQYGRFFRSGTNTIPQKLMISYNLLARLPEVKRINDEGDKEVNSLTNAVFFNETHGLIDRLQMLSIDDGLHVVTDQLRPSGMQIIWDYLANSVPHVIWKEKPRLPQANIYGHELGLLAPDDQDTSVSVSPVGEAYRILGWYGVLVLAPVVWFVLFIVVDSLCGDLRRSPWGILFLAKFAHEANEGALAGPIYDVTIGLISILFVAIFTGYVLPFVAALVSPPEKVLLPQSEVQAPSGP